MKNITNLSKTYNNVIKLADDLSKFIKDYQPQNANDYFDKDLMVTQLNILHSLACTLAMRININSVQEEPEEAPIMDNEPSVND